MSENKVEKTSYIEWTEKKFSLQNINIWITYKKYLYNTRILGSYIVTTKHTIFLRNFKYHIDIS